MASRKIRLQTDSTTETRESRFQESGLIHSTSPRRRRKGVSFDRTVSIACVFYMVLLLAFVVVLFIVSISIRFSGIHNEVAYSVTLGDTQLIPFNNFWCEGITVASSGTNVGPHLKLSLYLLPQQPSLTARNYFVIKGSFLIDQTVSQNAERYGWYATEGSDYVSWQFHLYPGSTFALDACLQSGGAAEFLLLQGVDNFRKWVSTDEEEVIQRLRLPFCSSGSEIYPRNLVFTSENDDEYFFVFVSLDETPPHVDVTMIFNRTEYSVKEFKGLPNCTITSNQAQSCILPNPTYAYNYALLVASDDSDSSENLAYGTIVDFQWLCTARGASYAIIFFIPFLILAVAGCGVLCFYLAKKRRVHNYEVLHSNDRTTGAPAYSQLPPPPPYTPSVL